MTVDRPPGAGGRTFGRAHPADAVTGAGQTGTTVRALLAGVVLSAVAGLLAAGLALPVVAGAGLAARDATTGFLALPDALGTPSLGSRSRVLAADGSLLATFYSVNHIDTPPSDIPTVMRQAVVAIEDNRFYEHDGLDAEGTARALLSNLGNDGPTQGGSTITQQYVKNALIASADDDAGRAAAVEQSLGRKMREARYALALEKRIGKDEILARYLDLAYFGNGVYGVATAAEHYYGRPVAELTLDQAATLAGVVQNPARFDVDTDDPSVRADLKDRRDTVLAGCATWARSRRTSGRRPRLSPSPRSAPARRTGLRCPRRHRPVLL